MLDRLNNNTIPCQSNPVSKSDLNTSSSSSVSPSVTNCLGPDKEIAEDDEFESFYGFTNSDIDIAKSKRLMMENFDNNYTSYSDIQSLRRSGPQSLGHYGQCGDQGENGQFGQHPGNFRLVAKKE